MSDMVFKESWRERKGERERSREIKNFKEIPPHTFFLCNRNIFCHRKEKRWYMLEKKQYLFTSKLSLILLFVGKNHETAVIAQGFSDDSV
jgi:hypothetical protein